MVRCFNLSSALLTLTQELTTWTTIEEAFKQQKRMRIKVQDNNLVTVIVGNKYASNLSNAVVLSSLAKSTTINFAITNSGQEYVVEMKSNSSSCVLF